MKFAFKLLPFLLLFSIISACRSTGDLVFPELGYKYFDKFVHDQYDGKIYIQEDHKGDLILPSRMFFLFGDMNDTFAGRMNMGPIYIGGNSFQQS